IGARTANSTGAGGSVFLPSPHRGRGAGGEGEQRIPSRVAQPQRSARVGRPLHGPARRGGAALWEGWGGGDGRGRRRVPGAGGGGGGGGPGAGAGGPSFEWPARWRGIARWGRRGVG